MTDSGLVQERKLERLFPQLKTYFSPKVIGEVNDVYVKVTKVKGDDVPWHTHDNEDELFYIVKGSLVMQIENQDDFTLGQGELYIVGKGVKHRVHSDQECWILLIEPKVTKHTGDVKSTITRSIEEQL
ncbi:MAG: cupin domain-containing protein [Candidatus Zixiibacteriota bacterium]